MKSAHPKIPLPSNLRSISNLYSISDLRTILGLPLVSLIINQVSTTIPTPNTWESENLCKKSLNSHKTNIFIGKQSFYLLLKTQILSYTVLEDLISYFARRCHPRRCFSRFVIKSNGLASYWKISTLLYTGRY